MSGSIIGTRKGLTRLGPLASITPICSDSVMIPPMPLATITETRSPTPLRSVNCACSTASPAAATASCEKRSIRLESFRLM